MANRKLPEFYCENSSQGAAAGLLGLMTGLSEEGFCAGWMTGLEYALWQIPSGAHYGMVKISENVATLLRLLAEEAGGWWYWDEHDDGPKFVDTETWIGMVKKYK